MSSVKNELALVIGGSRGMGQAIVNRLADIGYAVLFTYANNKGPADQVAEDIKARGGEAFAMRCKLDSTEDIRSVLAQASSGPEKFSVIVNNGAIWNYEPLDIITEESFSQTINANLMGPLLLAKYAKNLLADGGRIIMISSIGARQPSPDYLCYAASKAGLNAVTRGLAVIYGPKNVTVNAISPGLTDTEMSDRMKEMTPEVAEMAIAQTPLGRIGTPEDIAGAVALLVSPDSGWITGQVIDCAGGLM